MWVPPAFSFVHDPSGDPSGWGVGGGGGIITAHRFSANNPAFCVIRNRMPCQIATAITILGREANVLSKNMVKTLSNDCHS